MRLFISSFVIKFLKTAFYAHVKRLLIFLWWFWKSGRFCLKKSRRLLLASFAEEKSKKVDSNFFSGDCYHDIWHRGK